jgi:hypothetical protein
MFLHLNVVGSYGYRAEKVTLKIEDRIPERIMSSDSSYAGHLWGFPAWNGEKLGIAECPSMSGWEEEQLGVETLRLVGVVWHAFNGHDLVLHLSHGISVVGWGASASGTCPECRKSELLGFAFTGGGCSCDCGWNGHDDQLVVMALTDATGVPVFTQKEFARWVASQPRVVDLSSEHELTSA